MSIVVSCLLSMDWTIRASNDNLFRWTAIVKILRYRSEYLGLHRSPHGRSGARVNCHGIDAFATPCTRKNNHAWVSVVRRVDLTFSRSTVAFAHSSTFFFLFTIRQFLSPRLAPPGILRSPLLVITASNLFVAIPSSETTRITR